MVGRKAIEHNTGDQNSKFGSPLNHRNEVTRNIGKINRHLKSFEFSAKFDLRPSALLFNASTAFWTFTKEALGR